MKTEELIALGLSEDIAKKVFVLHGAGIEGLKTKLATAETTITGLNEQISTANNTIKGFKDLDVEGKDQAIKDWQLKHKTDTEALTKKLKDTIETTAIKTAIAKHNPFDIDIAMGLLDRKKIVISEGDNTIAGIEEQITALKESKPFIWKTGEVKQEYSPAGGAAPQSDDMSKWRAEAGLPPQTKE